MTKQLVVVLAIVRDVNGRYLLGRRYEPEIPAIHGKWNLLGGKLEYGESPEEAVVREVEEESGVEVRVLGMLSRTFIRYREKADGTQLQIVELPFLCVPIHEENILHQKDPKVDKLAFFSLLEIESLDLIEGEQEVLEEICQSSRWD